MVVEGLGAGAVGCAMVDAEGCPGSMIPGDLGAKGGNVMSVGCESWTVARSSGGAGGERLA